ncbi:hypothetical protein DMH04_13560 [Kibdelosporangium aridum]|uniref:Uncharacterized protein n=1 Tax=Kibdelosporangium aridum TaxID=2030 RepID=A0A428ZEY3_KIBAR|nr:hypothetical protein [Kibdelosporangium aridum]RSM86662.1 hypothetical protein DMH04_13560 [Kibdelosporangium aridum]
MTIAVGVFELFTYAIPGSLYVALFTFIAARAHWIDLAAVLRSPSFLLVIAVVLLSYLLGYLAYPLGLLAHKILPERRNHAAIEEFLRRNPSAKDRPFVQADPFLLLAAIQLQDVEVGADASRVRATGLMLRNCAPPAFLGAVAAIVELFVGRSPVFAITCAVLFTVASIGLVVQGRRLTYWARLRTLEIAFWIPEIDDKFRP